MNKSTIFLVSLLICLAGLYVYFFTDVFYEPTIQIVPQSRPSKKSSLNPEVYLTSFMLDDEYSLSSIKVFIAKEIETNKFANPIWHMIAETNIKPVNVVHYGHPIPGMKPAVAKARPKGLEPEVTYRLFLEAGNAKGQVDFHARRVETADPRNN